jgi:FkbM family methyltransferase
VLSIARAKAQWVTGDWNALLQVAPPAIESHPQRDRLALLVACAHQQQGSHERAADYARQALAWGCDARLAARLLVSGLHNTFGRIGALKGDNALAQTHFEQALGVTGDRDSKAAAHGRAVREMARLGLLPQAAWLVQDELDALVRDAGRPAVQASRVDMLRSEVELLQHELSLAQQRNLALTAQAPPPSYVGDGDEATLKTLSPSQLGQDLWVLERTGHMRGGFFVEFGATDGVRLSNTYLLETRFGWHGICAEPNPKMFAQLKKNRRCIVSNACIGPRSGETVEFVLAEEYGGRVQDMCSDMHADKRHAYWANDEYRATFETVSLHDLLESLGAPRQIDYLSIDTEGSEFDILAAFPFDRWDVRLITVEHNFTPAREQIRRLLESQGYERTERSHDDFYERQA